MANKKKVLFFLWSFSLGGGAEKILSTIVNHLDLAEYDVDILEMEHFDKGYEPVPDGVTILPAYQKKRYGRFIDGLFWRARMYFPMLIRKWLVKDKYDIEVSFTIMNPAFPFSKRKDVKKIAWIHGSIETFLLPSQQRYRKNHQKQLGDAHTIVAISQKTRESIEKVYPEYHSKLTTIYNGYDFSSILRQADEPLVQKIEKKSIGVIGRLEDMKGSDRVLDMFQQLHQIDPTVHLYYIGSGELEETLKKRVQEGALNDVVHFLGYQKNPYPYLKHMKVLLSLSKQEGFSGACVEAVTLGVPFVSTDVGGAHELSQNGKYGKVIETNKDAITAILNYMNGNQTIQEDYPQFIHSFTVEKQLQKIIQLFESP